MLRPRYSRVKLYKDAEKLLGGEGVAKRVAFKAPGKAKYDTDAGMIAAIMEKLGGAYSDKLDAEATNRDRDAADEMLEDYLKPQPAWKVEDDGSTPKTLRDAGFNVSMSDALGDQSLEGDEPADQNWMTADESKQFYNDEADRQQKDFDTRNPSGIDALKGSYATPGRQSMIDKLTGNTPEDTVGPMTRSMKRALGRDSAGKRESDEARLLAEQDARVKFERGIQKEGRTTDRGIEAANLAHTREIEVQEMKRKLQLKDKLDELNERDRLATIRDKAKAGLRDTTAANKPFHDLGLIPPVRTNTPTDNRPTDNPSSVIPALNVPQNAPTGSPRASSGTSLVEAQANAAGKRAGAIELAKLKAKAKADYPMVEHNSKFLLSALDAVVAPKLDEDGNPLIVDGKYVPGKEHAGLENFVGFRSPFGGAALMNLPFGPEKPIGGTNAADFEAKLGQVQGKLFLQAFETLKGGGQITEVEGEKATSALANLSASQSEAQFRAALLEFRYEVGELVKLARKRSGMDKTPTRADLLAEAALRGLTVQ
jgi:hypothetical protein